MASKLQIGIIGLGKFGYSFGKAMVELGHDVVGLDREPVNVKRSQGILTQTYKANATNKKVLSQLGFQDFSHVLVSVGDSITASAMISMHLMELGVPAIWVKAVNTDHAKLLSRIGIQKVIIPENVAAKQLANRIAMPGFIDYLPFDTEMILKQIRIKNWEGKTLRDINLTNQYQIQVLAIRKAGSGDFRFVPRADDALEKDDILVVIGHVDQLSLLKP